MNFGGTKCVLVKSMQINFQNLCREFSFKTTFKRPRKNMYSRIYWYWKCLGVLVKIMLKPN